jgi:hypothetical protein
MTAVVALLVIPFAPHARAAAPNEPGVTANKLWSKLLTRCGDSYFYAGSVFDGSGMLSDVQVSHQKTLEFKGVHFNSVPIRVTDAERANGIAYRVRVTLIAHLYREGGEGWQDGPATRPRNTDDIVARAIGSVNSNLFDMGNNGAMALELVKYKGIWAVTRRSVDSSGPLEFESEFFEVDKILAAKFPRYSCEKGAVVSTEPPKPSAVQPTAANEDDQ